MDLNDSKIIAISGSLRRLSTNTALLRTMAKIWDLDENAFAILEPGLVSSVPPFNQDVETASYPGAATEINELVRSADILVISTPEYNRSIPGQLKTVLDWMSRPFDTNPLKGKPTLVASASSGHFGGAQAQEDLVRVLSRIGAQVLDARVTVPHSNDAIGDDGLLHGLAIEKSIWAAKAALEQIEPAH